MGFIKTSIEEVRCNLTSFHQNVDKNALTAECSVGLKTKDFMLTNGFLECLIWYPEHRDSLPPFWSGYWTNYGFCQCICQTENEVLLTYA